MYANIECQTINYDVINQYEYIVTHYINRSNYLLQLG